MIAVPPDSLIDFCISVHYSTWNILYYTTVYSSVHVQLFVHSGLKHSFLLVLLYVQRGGGGVGGGEGQLRAGWGGGGGR
jgi:hypothetical protein